MKYRRRTGPRRDCKACGTVDGKRYRCQLPAGHLGKHGALVAPPTGLKGVCTMAYWQAAERKAS